MYATAVDDSVSESLADLGYAPGEIRQMMLELRSHDRRTVRDALFYSISDGTFDLEALVEEARQATG